MTFNKGDRVECIVDNPDDNPCIFVGSTGTVCRSEDDISRIGVRWDENVEGHNCGGACTPGHGWYVRAKQIQMYEEDDGAEIEESSFIGMIGSAK